MQAWPIKVPKASLTRSVPQALRSRIFASFRLCFKNDADRSAMACDLSSYTRHCAMFLLCERKTHDPIAKGRTHPKALKGIKFSLLWLGEKMIPSALHRKKRCQARQRFAKDLQYCKSRSARLRPKVHTAFRPTTSKAQMVQAQAGGCLTVLLLMLKVIMLPLKLLAMAFERCKEFME